MKQLLSHPFFYRLFEKTVTKKSFYPYFVNNLIKPAVNTRVLDIGCGPGLLAEALPETTLYTGVDANPLYIQYAKKKFPQHEFICDYITPEKSPSLPYKFDVAIAQGILHHLDDAECKQLMACAKHHLKEKGKLITVDGVYLDKQGKMAKWILSKDRGQYVRQLQHYKELSESVFSSIEVLIPQNIKRIPHNVVIMIMHN